MQKNLVGQEEWNFMCIRTTLRTIVVLSGILGIGFAESRIADNQDAHINFFHDNRPVRWKRPSQAMQPAVA
jgi:hypothetical protein